MPHAPGPTLPGHKRLSMLITALHDHIALILGSSYLVFELVGISKPGVTKLIVHFSESAAITHINLSLEEPVCATTTPHCKNDIHTAPRHKSKLTKTRVQLGRASTSAVPFSLR